VEGGIVMGLGYALKEDFTLREGIPQKTTLTRYKIPTTRDVPEIASIIVEHPTAEGPYGAKGIGELTSIAATPAITNAIHDAVGVRILSIPATSELVLSGLRAEDADED
jgi:xanthine dehydrogenase molybdenum-binding subunit